MPDKDFSKEDETGIEKALKERLGDMQYAFAEIRPDIRRNQRNNTVDVTFRAEETQRVFVEEINIKGNVRTLDKVIRREFDVVEGDPYSSTKIADAEKRIQNLDFFNKVVVDEEREIYQDQYKVVVCS